MADQSSLSSPSQKHARPISSFFGSPRFFNGFLEKGPIETQTMSPTSILDIKPFSTVANQPFCHDKNQVKISNDFSGNKHSWENLDPKGIGLGLIDSLYDEKTDKKFSQPNSQMVLFGSKLNIQIPPLAPSALSPTESPKTPADFGIKTRNSQFIGSLSPFGSANSSQTFPGGLSVSEMELSEDYTRVISHGPNPKTTHIYDNFIVESCFDGVGLSEFKSQRCSSSEKSNFPSESFLSFCYTCKKSLEQGKDIYMYRGEKAFCSSECRCQEMLFDGVEIPELDDA